MRRVARFAKLDAMNALPVQTVTGASFLAPAHVADLTCKLSHL
jgi:hypothetical protein